jgi:uncharacterized protein YdhG (YjbR/CyaY superfamily)
VPSALEQINDHRFLLVAPSGLSAQLSRRGAGLVALNVPDRVGKFADIVLGFDTDQEYENHAQLYFGSTIGRVANRIRGASFTLGDQTYRLAANDRPNHLHGGATRSFDKVLWAAEPKLSDLGPSVSFSYTSPHLEEGYPGQLELPASDRAMAKRLHAVIKASAPALSPKLWYGMPAYAKNGKVVCFFQSAQKFKTRYATFGFSDEAKLDEGSMWPNAFALMMLIPTDEARISALVKKAVS